MILPKTLAQIADEFNAPPKTFYNHIQKNAFLKANLEQGLQFPLQQKWIYERFGYPSNVDRKDYENV
jgi:hypothetical protein